MKYLYFPFVLAIALMLMPPRAVRAFVQTSYHGVLAIPGRAYYVDSVNGNDSNNGLSPSQAFQTIAHLTAADATTSINHWNLADGSDWREEIIVPRNNMTIESYGTGTQPLLDASDIISSGVWSKTAGYTNIYQATLPVEFGGQLEGSTWPSIWENSVRFPETATLAALDTTAGAYFTTEQGGITTSTTVVHYIHTSDGSNPAANGKLYEYSHRAAGIYSYTVTNATISGISVRRPYQNIPFALGHYDKCYHCTSTEGNTHNFYMEGNSECHYCLGENGYALGQPFVPYAIYQNPAYGEPVLIANSTAERTLITGTSSVAFVGFISHTDGISNLGAITLQNDSVIDTAPSITNSCIMTAYNDASVSVTGMTTVGSQCAYIFAAGIPLTSDYNSFNS